jgi:hypothetical protein
MATRLNTRLVALAAGLAKPSTESWNGTIRSSRMLRRVMGGTDKVEQGQ